ncbi:MAG: X-Pro aminopeptidase [Rhodobiaceae bacterium]|nr:MAG: X-Pro aminopeptidase [Rhodobiaceae bacterium]
MFQTYDDVADPTLGPDRAKKLQAELRTRGLDGFIIPRSDEHQGEYVPPHAERLRWLTGFSGSAGLAIVLLDKAAIFIDGRYTLQVRYQVDINVFEPQSLMDMPPAQWVEENLPRGAKLAYDPWLHTVEGVERLRKAAQKAGATLIAVENNLVDAVWSEQPEKPKAPIQPHPLKFAGEAATDKLKRITNQLQSCDANAAIITMPDSIAWLFNIRGGDVSHSPLPLSFAIVYEEGHAELFVDEDKIPKETRSHLGNVVTLLTPGDLGPTLDKLGTGKREIRIDPTTCATWIHDRLAKAGAVIKRGDDLCELPKARKNDAEVAGTRAAHIRDGQALSRFLAWLAREAPGGKVTEMSAAIQLEAFREETGALKEISFDTISGSGPNGAIVHYRVTTDTDRALGDGELFLVDSGAQYLDGTTDVTRTIAIGTPSQEMKDCFTRVLKGHISLASARFPKGTSGAQLDALARMALWQAGLDFDHGTGHGVGSYLSVHEGPQRISKTGHVPLDTGMIVSNEPGYYKTDAFGIRIENLLVVLPPAPIKGGEREMMGFETITLAPIDLSLVEASLLTADEKVWLNAYHARVTELVGPALSAAEKEWLEKATHTI